MVMVPRSLTSHIPGDGGLISRRHSRRCGSRGRQDAPFKVKGWSSFSFLFSFLFFSHLCVFLSCNLSLVTMVYSWYSEILLIWYFFQSRGDVMGKFLFSFSHYTMFYFHF